MTKESDIIKDARERFEAAKSRSSKQRARMLEDLRFSNPADPAQWDERIRTVRDQAMRPCLTFDQTNQYIAQVVNDARQNKPSIVCVPVDSKADPAVAAAYDGLIRQIEYASRAGIAYDTAIENAARVGLGYVRVLPEVVDPETNAQEIRIKRVHDPLSVQLDCDSVEPDGSDAMWGFVESTVSKELFTRMYPNRSTASWEGSSAGGWFGTDTVRVCEYQCVHEESQRRIVVDGPDGEQMTMSEDEYWELAKQVGFSPPVSSTFTAKIRKVRWYKITGEEVLEETDFPSRWIGIVPMIGYETWIDGERFLCGMVRRMMDGQRAYNYERSAYIETVALQPKAPWTVAAESLEGYAEYWENANTQNRPYLPYNAFDETGQPLPPPRRESPPAMSPAFVQGAMMAREDIQASIGMYRANLGAPSNETSGRAIRERRQEGDTANFHYVDNQGRTVEHVGRIIVDMIPTVYDSRRLVKLAGVDGSLTEVIVNPQLPQAAVSERGVAKEINPAIGKYDVRVKIGPAYTTQRQEVAEQLAQLLQKAPQFLPILGPMWVKMQDWPEAEKVSKLLMAIAPPQVQQAAQDGQEEPPDPRLLQAKEMIQQLSQKMEELISSQEAAQAQNEQTKLEIEAYKAETDRMQALAPALTPEQVNAIVAQTVQQIMNTPAEVTNDGTINQMPGAPADFQPQYGPELEPAGGNALGGDPFGGPDGQMVG